ncbi:carbohydrate kinase family protein [Embleya scabrispora]|uniref:carbohydrate kinase family protein n=1 Tax=Embleya scabrispora TaxID=159449 RepID=UPI0003A15627|nr:carbohydrate kinase [Embleya scabrispora]MYS79264.1 carbohydrate kinase [Streptomyces sp. SID5474]
MITVVGETIVDLVRPDGGTPVARPGGSPANVAVGLGRLGTPVRLVTAFGRDPYGALLAAHLAASSVTVVPGSVHDGPTSVARARVDESGVALYDFDITWDPDGTLPMADCTCLHTGSIAATLEPGASVVRSLVERAREWKRGWGRTTVSYDPNCRPSLMGDPESARTRIESLVALTDIVKVSHEDLEWLHPTRDFADVAADWLDRGPAMVVVTLGAKGSYGLCRAGAVSVPAIPVTRVDTVGAGDAYTAGMLDALHRRGILGAEDPAARLRPDLPAQVLAEASLTSALTCARPGADPPTATDVAAYRP